MKYVSLRGRTSCQNDVQYICRVAICYNTAVLYIIEVFSIALDD